MFRKIVACLLLICSLSISVGMVLAAEEVDERQLEITAVRVSSVAAHTDQFIDTEKWAATAVLSWATDRPATSQVVYGETADKLDLSSRLDPFLITKHTLRIQHRLEAGKTYYYKVISQDASGNEISAGPFSFTTPAQSEWWETGHGRWFKRNHSDWRSDTAWIGGEAFRRTVHIDGEVESAWIQIGRHNQHGTGLRLYVNGTLVGSWPWGFSLGNFDLKPYLTDGKNVIAITEDRWVDLITDGEIRVSSGHTIPLHSDPSLWKAKFSPPAGWMSPSFNDTEWNQAQYRFSPYGGPYGRSLVSLPSNYTAEQRAALHISTNLARRNRLAESELLKIYNVLPGADDNEHTVRARELLYDLEPIMEEAVKFQKAGGYALAEDTLRLADAILANAEREAALAKQSLANSARYRPHTPPPNQLRGVQGGLASEWQLDKLEDWGFNSVRGYLTDVVDKFLLDVQIEFQGDLEQGMVPEALRQAFEDGGILLSDEVTVKTLAAGFKWQLTDEDNNKTFFVVRQEEMLRISTDLDDTFDSYDLHPGWEDRLAAVITAANARGLRPILVIWDHGTDLATNATNRQKFIDGWGKIAQHVVTLDGDVVYDLLNEPGGHAKSFANDRNVYNELMRQTVDRIRKVDLHNPISIECPNEYARDCRGLKFPEPLNHPAGEIWCQIHPYPGGASSAYTRSHSHQVESTIDQYYPGQIQDWWVNDYVGREGLEKLLSPLLGEQPCGDVRFGRHVGEFGVQVAPAGVREAMIKDLVDIFNEHTIHYTYFLAAGWNLFDLAAGQDPYDEEDLALINLLLPHTHDEFIVDSPAEGTDSDPGDGICDDGTGYCTLRAAIQETNGLPGGNTIRLPAGAYFLTLTGTGEDDAATGDLDVTGDLTILGAGENATIISTDGQGSIFQLGGFRPGDYGPRSKVTLQVVDVMLNEILSVPAEFIPPRWYRQPDGRQ